MDVPWLILGLPHKWTRCVSDAVGAEHDRVRRDLHHHTRPPEKDTTTGQKLDGTNPLGVSRRHVG